MAKDEGKNLGYHWRRSAGVYDSPDRPAGQPKGNANTLSSDVGGTEPSQKATAKKK